MLNSYTITTTPFWSALQSAKNKCPAVGVGGKLSQLSFGILKTELSIILKTAAVALQASHSFEPQVQRDIYSEN